MCHIRVTHASCRDAYVTQDITLPLHTGRLKRDHWGGDGSEPISGTNSISTGTKIVPVGPWGPREIFLSSKMMNFQPQHIQKREIVDLQVIKYKYKSETKTLSRLIESKNAPLQKVLL